MTVTETSVETNSCPIKIIQYFIVVNYDYFLGQPEKLEPAAATDEKEQFLTVAINDIKSGWKVGSNFIVGNYNYLSGQSGSENKIQFKSKLSKASQEAVLRQHLLLKNEKKKDII